MASTTLWFWRYSLCSRSVLNARTEESVHEGALIRDFGGGVGCLHPWPSLGDASLEVQLSALQQERPTGLGVQALLCAEADGLARRKGRNLFESLKVPPSHFSAGTDPDRDCPAEVVKQGFRSVKFKGTPDLEALRLRLDHWQREAPDLRWRIDCNETLEFSSLCGFWDSLDPELRASVEFFEDPFPWDRDLWRQAREESGIPLAADRDLMSRAEEADFLVVKPAVVHPVEAGEVAFQTGQKIVVTSYLDHAIGQLYAAWRAAECAPILRSQLGDCGLLTQDAFEADPFFERLKADGPVLVPPPGTGLGFDDLLEDLPWKPLN